MRQTGSREIDRSRRRSRQPSWRWTIARLVLTATVPICRPPGRGSPASRPGSRHVRASRFHRLGGLTLAGSRRQPDGRARLVLFRDVEGEFELVKLGLRLPGSSLGEGEQRRPRTSCREGQPTRPTGSRYGAGALHARVDQLQDARWGCRVMPDVTGGRVLIEPDYQRLADSESVPAAGRITSDLHAGTVRQVGPLRQAGSHAWQTIPGSSRAVPRDGQPGRRTAAVTASPGHW
jgi:hypothetical protein